MGHSLLSQFFFISCARQPSVYCEYIYIYIYIHIPGVPRIKVSTLGFLWSSGQSFWLQIQRSRVRFPALPDFLSGSGSGTGYTQPREPREVN